MINVKVGNNSVSTAGNAEKLLLRVMNVGGAPDFHIRNYNTFANNSSRLTIDEDGCNLTSTVYRRRIRTTLHDAVEPSMVAMPKFGQTPPNNRLHKPSVIFAEAMAISKVDETNISMYMSGGCPDVKRVENALTGTLAPTPGIILRGLGAFIESKTTLYDNFAVYAK